MPADKTMGGEHPLVAIKRLAHWEVEDDLQMLRTRLACISAQVDKVAPADRAALVARLRVFAADMDALQLGAWADGMREAADVIAALTAPPEAAPTHGWQPIETAPPGLVDGKWTYVLFSGLSKGRSFPGRAVVSGWMGKTHNGRYEPVHNYSYKLIITHWMPLPPDPDAPPNAVPAPAAALSAEEVAALDPGIRDTVAHLRASGFDTTDSGDGRSKPADWFASGEALPFPHVAALTTTAAMVADAERMASVLGEEWVVEASYATDSQRAMLFARQDITTEAAPDASDCRAAVRAALLEVRADIIRRWESAMTPEMNKPTVAHLLNTMGHVNEAIDAKLAALEFSAMICAALATLVVLQALIIWRQRVWLAHARLDADRYRGLCREWQRIATGGAR